MFFTVYKTTNIINGKYYIGKHKTTKLNDGYLGSGKLLKRAIEKYGVENFSKEILFIFDNEEDMNNREKEIVEINENTYNLCSGGQGGFDFINRNNLNMYEGKREIDIQNLKKGQNSKLEYFKSGKHKDVTGLKISQTLTGRESTFKGQKHSEKAKEKMRGHDHQVGKKNSQFGTCWITNGKENKKIKKDELEIYVSLGFYLGRTI